ncbi:MAG: tetratricopeptide repeat protein [Planctomycetota bacterium]
MEQSDITYKILTADKIERTNLTAVPIHLPVVDPFKRIKYTQDGKASLISHEPEGEILKIFETAAEKLKQREYKEILGLYKLALELDPNYFKTWTNLGHTYYLLGDFDQAEQHLSKAVRLNDIGYHERLFLADTYLAKGQKQKALNEITYAYMLNKNNPVVRICLQRILEENNLRIRPDRFTFPFQIMSESSTQCKILFEGTAAGDWMAMANCLACWQMEPSFRRLIEDKEKGLNALLTMYKEAILNQVVVTTSKIDDKQSICPKEQLLYSATTDHFLNAMLFWEILGSEHPSLLLLLPKEEKARIIEYIKKYVYEGTSTDRCNLEEQGPQEYRDEGFSLKHPTYITINKETPVEDFNIYTFVHKRKTFLSAYVGNQPSFTAGGHVETGVSANGLAVQRISTKEKDGTIRTQVLISFSENQDWPMFMHFWYQNLPANLEGIAEEIIASVREQ